MKKRIAIIENNIISTINHREDLSRALLDNNYDLIILTTGEEKDLQYIRDKGFNVIDVKTSIQNPIDIAGYIARLKKELTTFKADVCLTFTMRPAIWGNIVTRKINTPTITTITGIGPLFEKNNIAYISARLLYKFVLKKTKKVFFQNHDDCNLFLKKKYVSQSSLEIIPGSGVDVDFYKPMENSNGRHFVFLFIGRLIKDKGIIEFVEAAKELKKYLPGVQFHVLGPKWDQNFKNNTITEEQISQWVDEGIIHYVGHAKDVRPFIANAQCIVLPSYREGASNALLEAASMSRPCITTNTAGCREIVEDEVTGYLCEVKNTVDLQSKMRKMYNLSASQRNEMGNKAREKVIKEYNKQLVIDAYLSAIEEII